MSRLWALIAKTFGAIPAKPLPEHREAPPVALEREVRRLATDKVENGKLFLVWPGPKPMTAEAANLDLAARIPIRTRTEVFALDDAEQALRRLREGRIAGAAVLQVQR